MHSKFFRIIRMFSLPMEKHQRLSGREIWKMSHKVCGTASNLLQVSSKFDCRTVWFMQFFVQIINVTNNKVYWINASQKLLSRSVQADCDSQFVHIELQCTIIARNVHLPLEPFDRLVDRKFPMKTRIWNCIWRMPSIDCAEKTFFGYAQSSRHARRLFGLRIWSGLLINRTRSISRFNRTPD